MQPSTAWLATQKYLRISSFRVWWLNMFLFYVQSACFRQAVVNVSSCYWVYWRVTSILTVDRNFTSTRDVLGLVTAFSIRKTLHWYNHTVWLGVKHQVTYFNKISLLRLLIKKMCLGIHQQVFRRLLYQTVFVISWVCKLLIVADISTVLYITIIMFCCEFCDAKKEEEKRF